MDQPELSEPAQLDSRQQLCLIADELRSIGNRGRHYASNLYEHERAERTLKLASRIASLVGDALLPQPTVPFEDHWIHVSPRLGVSAYVQNPAGEVLLLRRRDNGRWCLPGGDSEIGQTPSEGSLRELWEEAGLRGRVVRLLGAFDSRLWSGQARTHELLLVFLVECTNLTPMPGSEMTDARFFPPGPLDALPDQMSPAWKRIIPLCGDLARTGDSYIDPASSYDLELPMRQEPGHGRGYA